MLRTRNNFGAFESYNFANKKIGFLYVISLYKKTKNDIFWLCKCECGNEIIVKSKYLYRRHKITKSCGCRKKIEWKLTTTHKMSKTKIYRTWSAMHRRCKNKKSKDYNRYGGVGVCVCDEWNSFEKFYLDMGDVPLGKTLDRINSTGNYSKENCRWADYFIQNNNRKNTRKFILNGEEKTARELADIFNIPQRIAYWRLVNNWSYERIKERVNIKC